MEVFDDHISDSKDHGEEAATSDDALTAQEEEMLAMALEQSVRDVGGISVPVSPRSTFRSANAKMKNKLEKYGRTEPDFEKAVLRKSQDWNVKYTKKLHPVHKTTRQPRIREEDEEAARLAEEEQEKEMIQLAMERSLAEVPSHSVPPSPKPQEFRRGRKRFEHQPDSRPPRIPSSQSPPDADADEIARREEEMIRRALEMSRNDF